MADQLSYRTDLFEGTAAYYDRFRPPYPTVLLDHLRTEASLGARSRLLDLACGTGQLAFPFAGDVGEVVAVDQEADAVELGRRKAERNGLATIRWIVGSAEDVELDGLFDLVAIGNAFHRLDRDAVAARLVPHLAVGGCLALLWSETPWNGERRWQLALRDLLEQWRDRVGARDRVPERWEEVMETDPHEHVLRRAGFSYDGRVEHRVPTQWSVESLIGFMYSTSFLNRTVLGDHGQAFELDLRRRLLSCCPDGGFDQELSFAVEIARPGGSGSGPHGFEAELVDENGDGRW